MKKIICTHLYNDFSGSPLVLSTVIKGFIEKGFEVKVLTSAHEGFLSNLDVESLDNAYQFRQNRWFRLLQFLWTQVISFFQVLNYRKEDTIIYVNTLLPFGVAIAGKLMGKRVIYHIHETSVKPAILKGFLKWVAAKTASQIIYVSDYLRQQEPIGNIPSTVVHNALSKDFIETAKAFQKPSDDSKRFTVLMLCSLKEYKGVWEFVDIAELVPNISFNLVLNAGEDEISNFFKEKNLPNNLTIFPKQSNVHRFYQQADVVLNLSHPEQWVETFGMTLLEGMEYGIPAIAPPVGGCTEFVKHGMNGYQLDQRNIRKIATHLEQLVLNTALYQRLAKNAKLTAELFSVDQCNAAILKAVL